MSSATNSTLFIFGLLVSTTVAGPGSHSLLSLDFSDSTNLGRQTDSTLPVLENKWDVEPSATYPGTADFGSTGMLQGSFRHPAGPFTVEARFFVREYAPETTRFISDLVNTSTWDDQPIQGFCLRIGGGYQYPVLPENAYRNEALYSQSMYVSNTRRAELSRCLGEFDFASTTGGTRHWLEVYTNRCVERGRWNHMAPVWDGLKARLYLNGVDATDDFRLIGSGSQPHFDSATVIHVGSRLAEDFDQRHFNGLLDFVRVLDTAMTAEQIHAAYGNSLPPEDTVNSCRGVLTPVSPQAAELCDSTCILKIKAETFGACLGVWNAWQLSPTDSVEVELSREPDFLNPFLRVTVPDTTFELGGLLAMAGEVFSNEPCYWRVRLKPVATALTKRGASALPEEWSNPKPFFLNYAGSTAINANMRKSAPPRMRRVPGGYLLRGWQGPGVPELFGLDGKKVTLNAARISSNGAAGEAWLLTPSKDETGARLLLLKTPEGTAPILF
ncbi:MAG: LamG domain-containing protein [Fibrobacteria bacterium]